MYTKAQNDSFDNLMMYHDNFGVHLDKLLIGTMQMINTTVDALN